MILAPANVRFLPAGINKGGNIITSLAQPMIMTSRLTAADAAGRYIQTTSGKSYPATHGYRGGQTVVALPPQPVKTPARKNSILRPKSPRWKNGASQPIIYVEKTRHEKKVHRVSSLLHQTRKHKSIQNERKLKSILKVVNDDSSQQQQKRRGDDEKLDKNQQKSKGKRSVKFNYHAIMRRFVTEMSNPFEGVVYDDKVVPIRPDGGTRGKLVARSKKQHIAALAQVHPTSVHVERGAPLHRIPISGLPHSFNQDKTPELISPRDNSRLLAMLSKIEYRQQRTLKKRRLPRVISDGVPHCLATYPTIFEKMDASGNVVIREVLPETTATVVTPDLLSNEYFEFPPLIGPLTEWDIKVVDEVLQKWLQSMTISDDDGPMEGVQKLERCRTVGQLWNN